MALTLTEVETAISEIQTGAQSFSLSDGTAWNGASLPALMKIRDKLATEAQRSAGTRPTIRAFNFDGAGY